VVEALFGLGDVPDDARAAIDEARGEGDASREELVVARVLRPGGRSRQLLDGRLATATQVQRATRGLVDICSQHEHHTLSDPAAHAGFLDAFADLAGERDRMAAAHAAWRRAADDVDALSRAGRDRDAQLAFLRFQREELAAVAPREGELEALEAERARLAHAARLGDAARRADDLVGSGDRSASGLVARAVAELRGVRGLDPALDAHADGLESAEIALEEAARELGRYARSLVEDPARLAAVEDRLAALRRIARRHGSLDAAVARAAALDAEIAALDDVEARMDAAEAAVRAAAEAAVARARALSEARHRAARSLGEALTIELRELGMGEARVEVDVAPLERRDGELDSDGARVTATGLDRVELLVAPNRGEPPRPLRRIASGGELSRALLAIKRALARRVGRVLHVFDEIDTGVGGGVAETIGRKLADVARHGQVVCITHLAPIAVYGDVHLHVRKEVVGERTRAVVEVLDGDRRVEEIARMMGGLHVDDATRAAARSLLAGAAAHRARTVP